MQVIFTMLVFVVVLSALCLSVQSLTIGAFNIRVFGVSKSRKLDVMENIRQIILNYDVILIQEIRDRSQESMDRLYRLLNSDPSIKFSYLKSERLGRSSSKEQYAYYYRSDRVDIIATHQYQDAGDVFERPPFSVLLRVPLPDCQEHLTLALVGLHTKYSMAVSEIAHLDQVITQVKDRLHTRNAVLLGDLNAGCDYADEAALNGTVLFSNRRRYRSLIGHHADTTVHSDTSCAYDRILVSGNALLSLHPSAVVDRFDLDLGLSYTQAMDVSDHYPVKMTLNLPAGSHIQQPAK